MKNTALLSRLYEIRNNPIMIEMLISDIEKAIAEENALNSGISKKTVKHIGAMMKENEKMQRNHRTYPCKVKGDEKYLFVDSHGVYAFYLNSDLGYKHDELNGAERFMPVNCETCVKLNTAELKSKVEIAKAQKIKHPLVKINASYLELKLLYTVIETLNTDEVWVSDNPLQAVRFENEDGEIGVLCTINPKAVKSDVFYKVLWD